MTTFNARTSPLIKTAFVMCLLSAVAACGTPGAEPPAATDPRLAHPIQVAREQVSISIDLPADGSALSTQDAGRLRGFIRDFVGRGRTVVTVESQMPDRARQILEANGLRSIEINVVADTTIKAPAALLSFSTNVAKVPECGDWSDNYAFQPSNEPFVDFGCSNRRNLGLTVADPGDLIDAQPMTGHGAARRDTVLDNYNSGGVIDPNITTTTSQSASGVAQ